MRLNCLCFVRVLTASQLVSASRLLRRDIASSVIGLNSDGERSAYNSIQNPHREVFLAPDTLNRLAVHHPSRTGGNMNKLFHLAVWAVNHISNERHVGHRRMLSLKRPRQAEQEGVAPSLANSRRKSVLVSIIPI